MVVRLHALTVLASDPEALASFWGDLLGWERAGLELLPDADAPMRLSFEAADLPRARLNQVHLHLTSYTASQEANVARVLELGGAHLDVGQLPEEDHVVLADPEGNEFCVIEETNNWLAGMGFLGELAADGTREVGVFWAAALDWPLVHDEDGETAIAPPEGGMKIAWGGPAAQRARRPEPDAPRPGRRRPRRRGRAAGVARRLRRGAGRRRRDGRPGRERVPSPSGLTRPPHVREEATINVGSSRARRSG